MFRDILNSYVGLQHLTPLTIGYFVTYSNSSDISRRPLFSYHRCMRMSGTLSQTPYFLYYSYRAIKKKVTLSHAYNQVTSEPTNVRNSRCTVVTELVFVNCRIQNAFCCGVAILQHGLPWRWRPETLSRVKLQTNFESFRNNCCISRDCRLTGYFIINM
jgi:hypothetical protein